MTYYRLTVNLQGYPAGSVLLGWRNPRTKVLHIEANGREWTVSDGQAVPVGGATIDPNGSGAAIDLESKPDARAEEYQSAQPNKGRTR